MHHKRLFLVACSVLLVASCAKGRVRRETVIGKELYQMAMPTGKDVVHPEYGKEIWFGIGPITGKGKVNANGMVQAHVFEKEATIVSVELNILASPKGSFYAAWLVNPTTKEKLRLDTLVTPFKDVRHFLTKTVEKDIRAMTQLQITLEKAAGPSDTDPVQAEGTMTERKR